LVIGAAAVALAMTGITVLGGTGNVGGYLAFALLLFLALVIYIAPSMILYGKRHHRRKWALLLNVFLGWLGIPWLLLLVWAYRQPGEPGGGE
jgi:hypothetical protein